MSSSTTAARREDTAYLLLRVKELEEKNKELEEERKYIKERLSERLRKFHHKTPLGRAAAVAVGQGSHPVRTDLPPRE